MFLLVPAHLGFPGQIPQSRKTVVCCVCVLYCADTMFGENLDALQQAIAQHVSQNPEIQGQVCLYYLLISV